jgi:hypothetical protein
MAKLYKGVTKTALVKNGPDGKPVIGPDGKEVMESTIVARWEFSGPEKFSEMATIAEKTTVTVVAVNMDGTEKPAETAEFDNFDAWEYGAGLKANQLGRKASDITQAVKDHVLVFQGQKNDLDAKTPEDLAKALNMVAQFTAGGFDIGPLNSAKVASKTEKAIAAGVIHKNDKGLFVAGPVKVNGKTK